MSRGGDQLRAMFEASRIALVGASADPLSLSGRYLKHLRRHGYPGEIVPINPRREEIDGLACSPSVGAVAGKLDAAFILLDGKRVAAAVGECVDAGVPGVVVFSSGFGEAGEEGIERQRQIDAHLARGAGRTRLIGPNSPGFINYHKPTAGAASAYLQQADLIPGRVALVSQSGAIGGIVGSRALDRGIGLSHLVFTGNEADVDVTDCVDALVEDERVDCLAVVVETLRDLGGFRDVAVRVRETGKELIVMRIGCSEAGRRTAAAHTGALANDAAAVDAVLERAGALVVRSLDELIDLLDARRPLTRPEPRRLGVLCTSGGLASMAADATAGTSLSLPSLSERAAGEIATLIPDFGSTLNPTDLTGMIVQQPELIEKCLLALEDDGFDLIVVVLTVHPGPLSVRLAEHVIDARAAVKTPVIVAWESGSISYPGIDVLRTAGVPTFNSLDACLRALALLAPDAPDAEEPATREPAVGPPRETVPELRALERLAPFGLRGPAAGLAQSAAEAVSIAARVGLPVVAKLQSGQVPHRGEHGGVLLGLDSPAAVADAFAALGALAERLGVELEGVSIAAQAAPGIDLFVGARRTEAGWLLVLAPGGGDVESSTAVWRTLLPVEPEALARARERVLGLDPAVQPRLEEILARFEGALERQPADVSVVELNPLRLGVDDNLVLDALIELDPATEASP